MARREEQSDVPFQQEVREGRQGPGGEVLTGGAAQEAFAEIAAGHVYFHTKGPGRPRLLVMSGLPMSGKSYLANMISERMEGKVCIVRSDHFRPVVARRMGRSAPVYDRQEHALVFEVGGHLVRRALENGWSTIADATNLTDEYRRWAVDAARGIADGTLVAFLDISLGTAMERVKEKDRDGSAATPAVYALLKYEREPVDRCTAPYVVINSETDIRPWADQLSKWLSGEADRVAGTVIPRPAQPRPGKGRVL